MTIPKNLALPISSTDTSLNRRNESRVSERVNFRLIETPCCHTLLCYVNHRLPNYCSECGQFIFPVVRGCVLVEDADATLKRKDC